MTIADAVWLATALLHMENARAVDFSTREITEKAIREKLVEGFRPGLQVHVTKHCVANKSPNPGRCRMLVETSRGRRRLFRNGDSFHPDREGGRTKPKAVDVPPQYAGVLRWYERFYDKGRPLPQVDLLAASRIEDEERVPTNSVGDQGEPQANTRTAAVGPQGEVVIPLSAREELGIKEGMRLVIQRQQDRLILQPITEDYISNLRGCCKGEDSLVEALQRDHRHEK